MSESGNTWQTLVNPGELAAALGRADLVVLDARVSLADRTLGEADYRQSHIPGARFAELDRDLSVHRKSGGCHPWPGADDFTATAGGWGIRPGSQVVVSERGDGALAAARAGVLPRSSEERRGGGGGVGTRCF